LSGVIPSRIIVRRIATTIKILDLLNIRRSFKTHPEVASKFRNLYANMLIKYISLLNLK